MESASVSPVRTAPPSQDAHTDNPRTRKGHKKSRGGCYNCKRRKVKCQENHPACHNCTRINLSCKYPSPQVMKSLQNPDSMLLDSRSLQSTPVVFNASDMRLFHHFIMHAYPHVPLGNDTVWQGDIAAIAHSYDYLLQSMLAVAASHLTLTSSSQLRSEALSYRVKAIGGLKKALSIPPRSKEDADAIMATCATLSFQAQYIGESIEEFLTMMRGLTLVANEKWNEKFGTSFRNFDGDTQKKLILSRLENIPLVNQSHVVEGRDSLRKVEELQMDEVENEFRQYLIDILELLCVSSRMAYMKYRKLHAYLALVSHDSFQAFIHSTNAHAQILMAHYIALLGLMLPIKSREWAGRNMGIPNRETMFKMDSIWKNMPESLRGYIDWPMRATGSVPGVPARLKLLCSKQT